jgi:hypothetical protein
VGIPLVHAAAFLQFLLREIQILPVWICPIRTVDAQRRFPLYPLQVGTPYVNFGFWTCTTSACREPDPPAVGRASAISRSRMQAPETGCGALLL